MQTAHKTHHLTAPTTHILLEHIQLELQKTALHTLVQKKYKKQGLFADTLVSTIQVKRTPKAPSCLATLHFEKGQTAQGLDTLLMHSLELRFLKGERMSRDDAKLQLFFQDGMITSVCLFFCTRVTGFQSQVFQAHFEHPGFSDLLDYCEHSFAKEAPNNQYFWINLTTDLVSPRILFISANKNIGDSHRKPRFTDIRQHTFQYNTHVEEFRLVDTATARISPEIYTDSLQSLLGMIPLSQMIQ